MIDGVAYEIVACGIPPLDRLLLSVAYLLCVIAIVALWGLEWRARLLYQVPDWHGLRYL